MAQECDATPPPDGAGAHGRTGQRMKCRCGNTDHLRFEDVSDAQTGTMYARCVTCGAYNLASPAGFVDWHIGLMLDSAGALGSAWTQQPSPLLLPDLSRLSTHTQL